MSTKLRLSPHKTRQLDNAQIGWWYEGPRSITVHIYSNGSGTISCRIDRSEIEKWLKRSKEEKP